MFETLSATQEFPQHTLLHLGGTPSVPPQLKKSPVFPSSSGEEGPFPCFVRKGIPASPSHLKRRRAQLEAPEELHGSRFKKTLMSQSIPDQPHSPALTRLSCRVSTQNMMEGVTALWHLEQKPQIPMSTRQEALHYIDSSRGKRTFMSPHKTRPDSHVETP